MRTCPSLIFRFTRDFKLVPLWSASHLRLYREACLLPRVEFAENGAYVGEAVMQKNERRTGAGVFIRSGAVGDDPLVLVQRHAFRGILDACQRDGERPVICGDECFRAAHIHDDGCPLSKAALASSTVTCGTSASVCGRLPAGRVQAGSTGTVGRSGEEAEHAETLARAGGKVRSILVWSFHAPVRLWLHHV